MVAVVSGGVRVQVVWCYCCDVNRHTVMLNITAVGVACLNLTPVISQGLTCHIPDTSGVFLLGTDE